MRFYLFFVFLFNIPLLYANSQDSLSRMISEAHDDKAKLLLLLQEADMQMEINPHDAMESLHQALEIAESLGDDLSIAECNSKLGDIYYAAESYVTSVTYLDIASQLYQKYDDFSELSKIYLKMSEAYQAGEFIDRWSIASMQKSLCYAKKSQNMELYFHSLLAFGYLYQRQNSYFKSDSIYSSIINDPLIVKYPRHYAVTLSNMAQVAFDRDSYDSVHEFSSRSIEICKKNQFSDFLISNYIIKAAAFSSQGRNDSADILYRLALAQSLETHDTKRYLESSYDLAVHYFDIGEYEKAITVLKPAIDTSVSGSYFDDALNCYLVLSETYDKVGNYKQAYENHVLYDHYMDSSYYEWNNKQLVQQKIRYLLSIKKKDISIKEAEISVLKQKEKVHTLQIVLMVVAILLVVSVSVGLFFKMNVRNKKEKLLRLHQQELNRAKEALLESELSRKTNSMIDLALHLNAKYDMLLSLKTDLKSLKNLSAQEQEPRLMEIISDLQQAIKNTEELNDFQGNLQNVNKEFNQRLEKRFPELTKSESRLCALLRLKMSSKEIAVLNNITVRAVETARYRLRKKLGLDRDDDMIDFLKNI